MVLHQLVIGNPANIPRIVFKFQYGFTSMITIQKLMLKHKDI